MLNLETIDLVIPEEYASIRDVIHERQRQIMVEGWDAEHDSEHKMGTLARAAMVYAAFPMVLMSLSTEDCLNFLKSWWPFEPESFKPKTYRQDLVRAAALILAEIDKMDAAGINPITGRDEALAEIERNSANV